MKKAEGEKEERRGIKEDTSDDIVAQTKGKIDTRAFIVTEVLFGAPDI